MRDLDSMHDVFDDDIEPVRVADEHLAAAVEGLDALDSMDALAILDDPAHWPGDAGDLT